jgi:hypothetical protein
VNMDPGVFNNYMSTGAVASVTVTVYFLLLILALRRPGSRLPLYRLFVILAIIGFVTINFIAELPGFLVAENLTYAVLFTLSLVFSDGKGGQLLSLLLSMFAAGRVSRSIISPDGKVMDLAAEHIPLEVHLLFIGILSWILLATPRGIEKLLEDFPEPSESGGD